MQRLLIDKTELSTIAIEQTDLPEVANGQLLLKIDSFGLSANNITYAVLGDTFKYWGFFPAHDNWGVMPVWGFAEVAESKCEGIEPGRRVFGYLPCASHLLVEATKLNKMGFMDAHPARKSISPVYDQYVFCDTDMGYSPDLEDWQITYRPLFMTSFVLAKFVEQLCESLTGPQTIILTSASSKTAYGTAMLLKSANQAGKDQVNLIGLTSSKNKAFVAALECYDSVIEYGELSSSDINELVTVLDFAGNKQTLGDIQKTCRQASCQAKTLLIGATDVEGRELNTDEQTQGEVFFAPAQVKLLQTQWGPEQFFIQYQQAWTQFLAQVNNKISSESVSGFDNIGSAYQKALSGKIDPEKMLILKP